MRSRSPASDGISSMDTDTSGPGSARARLRFRAQQALKFLSHGGNKGPAVVAAATAALLLAFLILALSPRAAPKCPPLPLLTQPQGEQQGEQQGPSGPFIYVYELGSAYTKGVYALGKPQWYSIQYEVEKDLAELLQSSSAVRTVDPSQASLFFIPFYSARYTNYFYHDKQVNMVEAVQLTSAMWVEVLSLVQRDYPFFNRSRGKDHFAILSMDHGRCTALTFVPPSLYGDMFFVTYNGDIYARSDNCAGQRTMQAITYSYGERRRHGVPSIPCFIPGHDIVVPPKVTLPFLAPNATARNITLVFRFSAGQHHGVPTSHHGHEIRREIIETFQKKNISGWDFAVKNEQHTMVDWTLALFTACPPGHSQWTSRPYKALISGSIPITFSRSHVEPFEDMLDYSSFSINVDPDNIPQLDKIVSALLTSPSRITQLQEGVLRVQSMLKWSGSFEQGCEALLLRQLREKAAKAKLMRRRTNYIE